MSLQSLFAQVEDAYGYIPKCFKQNDTSAFDRAVAIDDNSDDDVGDEETNSTNETKSNKHSKFLHVSEPQNIGHNLICNIDRNRKSYCTIDKITELNSIANASFMQDSCFAVPEIDWDDELKRLVNNPNDSDTNDEDEDDAVVVDARSSSRGDDHNRIKRANIAVKAQHQQSNVKNDMMKIGDDFENVFIKQSSIGDVDSFLKAAMNEQVSRTDYSDDLLDTVLPNPVDSDDLSSAMATAYNSSVVCMTEGGDKGNSAYTRATMPRRPTDGLCITAFHKSRHPAFTATLNHHIVAKRHKHTDPFRIELSESELRHFHRPRLLLNHKLKAKPWRIVVKKQFTGEQKTSSTKSYSEIDKLDLSLIHGEFICLEYIEEKPPLLMNYGMVSSIFNFCRAPDQRDVDEKQQRNKLEVAIKAGLDDKAIRIPRHVRLLIQQRDVSQTFESNMVPLSIGETKVLSSDDKSPFLGDIEENEVQQAIVNNLFKAPIFQHDVNPCDFLLIRSGKQLNFTIRKIPRMYVVGQLEPLVIVPSPTRTMSKVQEKIFLLSAARYLHMHPFGVDFDDIQRAVCRYSRKKVDFVQQLKKLLKIIATPSDNTGRKWDLKDHSIGPGGIVRDPEEVAYLEKSLSPEELENDLTPEDVCINDACNEGELYLERFHMQNIDLERMQLWLARMGKLQSFKEERIVFMLQLSSHPKYRKVSRDSFDALKAVLKKDIQRLATKIKIGQYIFDRLIRAPWNTTQAYVRSYLMKDGNGRMTLFGPGDPSGCSEGFAFVRLLREAASLSEQSSKRYPGNASRSRDQLMRIEQDLKNLSKNESIQLLVKMGISIGNARALKRWERRDMIKDLLQQSKKGNGVRKDSVALIEGQTNSFKTNAQLIWNRQKNALSKKDDAVDINRLAAEYDSDSDFDIEEDIDRTLQDAMIKTNRSINIANINAKLEVEEAKAKKLAIENELQELKMMKSIMTSKKTSSLPSNKVHARIGDNSNNDNFRQQQSSPSAAAAAAAAAAAGGGGGGGGSIDASSSHGYPSGWVRPSKVVKVVRRVLSEDGTETVSVHFIISDAEVERVQQQQAQESIRKTQLSKAHLASSAASKLANAYNDDNETIPQEAKLTFKLSLMSKVVNKANAETKKVQKIENEGYKPTKGTARATAVNKTYRMPHVMLAALLEKEIMFIWQQKKAIAFRYPVPTTLVDYYKVIQDPICLSDIREKLIGYHYKTAQELLNDMELMVRNCETFNGANSPIAKDCRNLLKQLSDNVFHELKTLGPEKDMVTILEDAIVKKFAYLNRQNKVISSSK